MNTISVTTPAPTELIMTRTFDAPKALVFAAHTEAEHLRHWRGRGNPLDVTIDFRVGGAWRFVSRGPDGAEMGQGGVYRVVAPPDRLVHTEVFDDQSYPGESLVTHDLVERDGRTTLTSTVRYATPEGRDTVLRYPMARGVGESYGRLAELLRSYGQQQPNRGAAP